VTVRRSHSIRGTTPAEGTYAFALNPGLGLNAIDWAHLGLLPVCRSLEAANHDAGTGFKLTIARSDFVAALRPPHDSYMATRHRCKRKLTGNQPAHITCE
jgi:hypothetical protein